MRKHPRVVMSDLTSRAYVLTDYTVKPNGGLVAHSKQDVTADVVHDLMAAAWARGWRDCNAASVGESAPNPYRPAGDETER